MRWLDGITDSIEFEEALGVDNGQGSLACYSPWGYKESDMTEHLNWTGKSFTCLKFQFKWASLCYLTMLLCSLIH